MSRKKKLRLLKKLARIAEHEYTKHSRIIESYIKNHPWAKNNPRYWGFNGAQWAVYRSSIAEYRISKIIRFDRRFITLRQAIEIYKNRNIENYE